jgi:predicted transcriptional regulator
MSSTDAWLDADRQVLTALSKHNCPCCPTDLRVDLDQATVRMVLHQNANAGLVRQDVGAVRTTYTLTEKGRQFLADAVKVG